MITLERLLRVTLYTAGVRTLTGAANQRNPFLSTRPLFEFGVVALFTVSIYLFTPDTANTDSDRVFVTVIRPTTVCLPPGDILCRERVADAEFWNGLLDIKCEPRNRIEPESLI